MPLLSKKITVAVGMMITLVFIALVWMGGCRSNTSLATNETVPDKIDFNLHIRPILSDRCFKCHGPDPKKREASLRLDIADSAYAALKDNPSAHAITPGDPLLSEVYLRISSLDTAEQMPPPSSNLSLTAYEIELIRKWIEQGAEYKPHWAFVAPQAAPLPKVKKSEWVKNNIDYFILAKLEEKKLSPNEEADKEQLLKRVSFDLTLGPPISLTSNPLDAST